jgi:hypothetical protein
MPVIWRERASSEAMPLHEESVSSFAANLSKGTIKHTRFIGRQAGRPIAAAAALPLLKAELLPGCAGTEEQQRGGARSSMSSYAAPMKDSSVGSFLNEEQRAALDAALLAAAKAAGAKSCLPLPHPLPSRMALHMKRCGPSQSMPLSPGASTRPLGSETANLALAKGRAQLRSMAGVASLPGAASTPTVSSADDLRADGGDPAADWVPTASSASSRRGHR